MATVVLVHGIAQEQGAADTLEAAWLPALTGGIRTAGHPDLADQIRRSPTQGIDVRMAYYGDLYIAPDAQGAVANQPTSPPEQAFAEDLARHWLQTAATHATDPRDRELATQQLDLILNPPDDAQGGKATLRPAMNALARLRWFAPLGIGLAGKFVNRTLTQVTRYLSDDQLRHTAQHRVLKLVGPDTRLVIAHSLGTVVAYEALHQTNQPVTLITLGSPLGLRTVIYERLRPQPSSIPACVQRWHNFADHDDLVAAQLDLNPLFPPSPGSAVTVQPGPALDNGSQPHDATHYLTKTSVGQAVAEALTSQ